MPSKPDFSSVAALCLLGAFFALAQPATASTLYVGVNGGVARYDLDGSGALTVVPGFANVQGFAVDPLRDDLYYTALAGSTRVYRRDNDPGNLDLNFGDTDTLFQIPTISNTPFVSAVDVDPLREYSVVNITDNTNVRNPVTTVQRQSFAGGGLSTLVSLPLLKVIGFGPPPRFEPRFGIDARIVDVAVDPLLGQIYWTDRGRGNISRTDIEGGGGAQVIIDGLSNPQGIAFDAGSGNVYWTEQRPGDAPVVRGANADALDPGTTISDLYTGVAADALGGIAVDPFDGSLFWTEGGRVRRSDLDGGNVADFLAGGSTVFGEDVALSLDAGLFVGDSQDNPRLPDVEDPGLFQFNRVRRGAWVDPPTADAFTFRMTDGSLFTRILDFPTGFDRPFNVTLVDGTSLGSFSPGDLVEFAGGGVTEFTVSGISPLVDPADPLGFPLRLDFSTTTASFQMIALDAQTTDPGAVPTPATLGLLALGLAGIAARGRRCCYG